MTYGGYSEACSRSTLMRRLNSMAVLSENTHRNSYWAVWFSFLFQQDNLAAFIDLHGIILHR
jgi:hypothetical protein